MSVRENVLRLSRWRLQERQEYLAGLESLLGRLGNDLRRLQDDAAAGPSPRPLAERQRKIERSIAEVEARIGEARSAVDAALQEVKLGEGAAGAPAAAPPMRVIRRTRRPRRRTVSGSSQGDRTRTV